MKLRRIKTPDVTAYFLKDAGAISGAPKWVTESCTIGSAMTVVATDSGAARLEFPTWLIREQSENGAYPVSKEYIENNFELVPENKNIEDEILDKVF